MKDNTHWKIDYFLDCLCFLGYREKAVWVCCFYRCHKPPAATCEWPLDDKSAATVVTHVKNDAVFKNDFDCGPHAEDGL